MLSIVFASTRAARLRLAFPVIVASTMATLGASACGRDTELPGPPPPPPPHATCAIAVTEPGPGKDLFVSGDPSCGAAVTASVRVATGDPSVPVWTELARAPIAVEGAWEPAEGGLRRKVRVTNRGASAVSLVGLEWTFDVAGFDADRFFHDGYQSWAYTGLEAIPASLVETRGTFKHGGTPGDTTDELQGVGFWVGAIVGPSGRALVVGADGGTVLKTSIGVEPGRMRLLQGGDLEAALLAPGATRELDGVFVAMGDMVGGLDAYARVVSAAHPPVSGHVSGGARKPALGGWGSWNLYYAGVTAANMRDEAAWAKTELVPRGLTDFLLDDGYEAHWGSWSAKPEFGASLDELAREQRAAGLAPAIWLAPFVVSPKDPDVAAHPEYFVKDAAGALRMLEVTGHGPMALLDPTNEGARARLRTDLERLVAAGYQTFKLDFLYAGALAGVRSEPTTALESYARLFSIVREAVGDAHLVACGAPLLPTVGWVDSFRTGPDIAFEFSPEPNYTLLLAQARHTALRAFTDRFWSLDPDVLLLRGDRIDDVEAWTTTVVTALSGGNYLLGDGRQVSAERLAMALSPGLSPFLRDGRAARPDDLRDAGVDPRMIFLPQLDTRGETAVPHVWRKTSVDGKAELVAVFGWASDPFEARVSLGAGAEELGPKGERSPAPRDGRVVVPRHAVRLFIAPR